MFFDRQERYGLSPPALLCCPTDRTVVSVGRPAQSEHVSCQAEPVTAGVSITRSVLTGEFVDRL